MAIETPYRTIGQIRATNTTCIQIGTGAVSAAIKLLAAHTPGAPVTDFHGKFVGFVDELDLMKVFEAGEDPRYVKVEDIMDTQHLSADESTPIDVAVRYMELKKISHLPVIKEGIVVGTVTSHDLLRVLLKLDIGIEH